MLGTLGSTFRAVAVRIVTFCLFAVIVFLSNKPYVIDVVGACFYYD